ncbi:hypothetical protein [Lachnoclostridium phytofermentans]|uniref:Prenyltransferase n=1 Tax=Lachnoclostridium phytofermentans (strain ATCC 700394 / DSM 18823 / ISDg) TaxID=357809 RepID=A9KK03_LACP7|nr:hypothetical protein [Lachnoclostridium phytofermentans]ABX42575.1 hypothetical protein Cphy_2209 [Lachnoclostridium phytofermentans ISDg]
MKKLSKQSFDEIRLWIYRNARPIELAIWQYEFENGSKEVVLSALSFYQNEDGGFGNALEADSWNPNSSPYTTLNAISKLIEIDFCDINHPILQGIFKFLESGIHSSENGWFFSIPSNNDYPHAPWWTYDSEANEYESIGLSAGIACFVLKFADKDSPLYKRTFSIVEKLITKLSMSGKYGEMGVGGYCELMETIPQLGLSDRFDMDFISSTVKRLVYDSIERDISKWIYYGKTPSSFISSPDSVFYKDNEEIMQKELDYIIEKRPSSGVWGITWSWFENNEKYLKEIAISENWWKADVAIRKLKLLRNFNRIEY